MAATENEHGYLLHPSMSGPALAPYPPYVQTESDTRRWDAAYGIAEGLSRLYEDDGEPDARWVWHTTRALYFDRSLPTGDAPPVREALEDEPYDRARHLLAELERRKPADPGDREQLDAYLEALADYFEHILGPLAPIDYEHEVAEAWSPAARLASARSRREHARGRLARVHGHLRVVHQAMRSGRLRTGLRDQAHRAHVAAVARTQTAIANALTGAHPAERVIEKHVHHPGRRNVAAGAAAALAPDPRESARFGATAQAAQDALDNKEHAQQVIEKSLEAAKWAHEHRDTLRAAGHFVHHLARAKGLVGAAVDDLGEAAQMRGAMVALYPDEETARRLAVEGGEPADELHVTLKYLGDDHEAMGDELKGQINYALEQFAKREAPLEGSTDGTGEFKPDEDGNVPVYARVRVPGIQGFRRRLVAALPDGVMEDTHPSYKPHVTLKYVPEDEAEGHGVDAGRVPLRFREVHAVYGGDRVSFPLAG